MVTNQHRDLGTGGLAASPLGLGCMYGPFTNDKLAGRAVREWSGEGPLIATKFGNGR